MNFFKKILLSLSILNLAILAVSAQQILSSINNLVGGASSIAVNVVSLLMTVAFIAFMVTVITFIWKRRSGDSNGAKQALGMLWWAVFAMFIMVAVWGIVAFLSGNLGIGVGGCVDKPSPIPGQPSVRVCNNGASLPVSGNGGISNGGGSGGNSGSGSVVRPGTSAGAGNSSSCYNYTNAQCAQYAGCKVDPYDGCVPNTSVGAGNSSSCYNYTNAQCAQYAGCKVDPYDGCVPNVIITTPITGSVATPYRDRYGNSCSVGNPIKAANGDILYCQNGVTGELCTDTSCSAGYYCSMISQDATYGTCGRL